MEEKFDIDAEALVADEPTEVKKSRGRVPKKERDVNPQYTEDTSTVSCLRDEKVTVQYILKERTGITDKDHPYYGGLANNATITLTLPMLRSGAYVDPLTKSEKDFLEEYLGLEVNALSVYNKVNNFWDNFGVKLSKDGTILNLNDPNDYLRYKVLLVNKDFVASSVKQLNETPLETYRFVLISHSEVYNSTIEKTNIKSKCWKDFGKVEDNFDVLKCIIETIDGRPVSPNTKIEFLKEKIDDLIDLDGRRFLSVIEDPLLNIKVLIKKAVEKGVIDRRGDFYYYDKQPLCGNNEDPTFTIAARYLGAPKNQELKFSIEAKIK